MAIPGNLQPASDHNGILVDKPPSAPHNEEGAHVSDDQVAEILAAKGLTARYPWTLAVLHAKLVAAKNSDLQHEPNIYREIRRGLQGIYALWPIVGEGHWRAMLLDDTTRTIFLFDSFGAGGWGRSRIAAGIKQMLKDLESSLQFSLVILDIRVQGCGFQCGIWIMWFLDTGHTWRLSHPDNMRSFPQYLKEQMAARGISTLRPRENRAFAARMRVELRAHVTNPRSRGEPRVGQFSEMCVYTQEQDHFAEDPPHAFCKGVLMRMYPRHDGSPPLPLEKAKPPCNREHCFRNWLHCCSLPTAPGDYTSQKCIFHLLYRYIQVYTELVVREYTNIDYTYIMVSLMQAHNNVSTCIGNYIVIINLYICITLYCKMKHASSSSSRDIFWNVMHANTHIICDDVQ